MCELQIIKKGASVVMLAKGVKKMGKNEIFFGIRTALIVRTRLALRKRANATTEEGENDEILTFLELFKAQEDALDLTIYTDVRNGRLYLESPLTSPDVRYDVADIDILSAEKRAESIRKMEKEKNVSFFHSKIEALETMTSI